MLPILNNLNVKTKEILEFGGLGAGKSGNPGITFAENVMPDAKNRLTVRPKRYTVKSQADGDDNLNGIGAGKALFYIQGNGFYYNGVLKGSGSVGVGVERKFAVMNDKILIMPDKLCYDIVADTLGSVEAEVSCSLDGASFVSGTLGGEDAGVNTVSMSNMIWDTYGLRVGDGITVSYQSSANAPIHTRTATVCELTIGYLRCGRNAFDGLESQTIVGIGRHMPDLDFIFECGNRIWGAKGFKIYCSAPGDMSNWNSSQAWNGTVGSGCEFNGGIAYNGTPTFFTADSVRRVYGAKPTNFEIAVSTSVCGIAPGSSKSLAIADGKLLYLSENGVMSYSGGIPERISAPLGDIRLTDGVAVSDGRRYYLQVNEADGSSLFVYDTEDGLWTREDAPGMNGAVCFGNIIYACGSRKILTLGKVSSPQVGWAAEGELNSAAVFGEDFFGTLRGKQPIALCLSVGCKTGAEVSAYLSFDGGEFTAADCVWSKSGGNCDIEGDTEYFVSIPLRYCACLSLKLTGEGDYTIRGLGIRYREVRK